MHDLPHPVTRATQAIGRTPVVQLSKIVPPDSAQVYVKLESVNPTGSYKDRMALAMIEEAEKRGDLRPGMTVVEYTGGSTGSSLAFVCAVKGYRFRVVSSDAFAQEKLRAMQAFGAELDLIPSDGGKITRDLIQRMMTRAEVIAQEQESYPTNQFHNRDSLVGYAHIGRELAAQIARIDLFCAGVGTAGMCMGVASELRALQPRPRIVILEPASSAVISTGKAGAHRIEGMGVGFVPPLLDMRVVDAVHAVEEDDARSTARRLAKEEGLFVGISSGLNVAAALRFARELGPGHTVVTVACDSGLKYLAGDLFDQP